MKELNMKNSIFKDKYSVKTNSRLFIRNISTDELGVYYCVKTSEPRKFSNGTKIYISDFVHKNISVHRNQTESDDAPQQQTPWKTMTITAVLLNVLLIIALIGIVKSYIDVTGRSKNDTAAKNLNNLQCAEIDFSMCPSNIRLIQEQSTTVYSQFLLMWSQVTESLTNIAVSLGADVNISCDLDIKEVYWYKQKSPDPPVFILRTYSSIYEGAEYENSIFEDKYSVKTNSHLFIRNISTDELGVYYCVKTSEPRKFSNGTKIYISDFVHKNITESVQRNQTESDDAPQQQAPWRTVTITSVLLNVLLIITLIGLKQWIQRDVREEVRDTRVEEEEEEEVEVEVENVVKKEGEEEEEEVEDVVKKEGEEEEEEEEDVVKKEGEEEDVVEEEEEEEEEVEDVVKKEGEEEDVVEEEEVEEEEEEVEDVVKKEGEEEDVVEEEEEEVEEEVEDVVKKEGEEEDVVEEEEEEEEEVEDVVKKEGEEEDVVEEEEEEEEEEVEDVVKKEGEEEDVVKEEEEKEEEKEEVEEEEEDEDDDNKEGEEQGQGDKQSRMKFEPL
ncbi:hypothetical protein QQF64_018822 [Cirrhinus molitorella]|uniref:Ig-like domain-containing protein n=1 Tax=Cirrhinus molitorella TaxID=172907 RepID=A0ABR3LG46_9TELE